MLVQTTHIGKEVNGLRKMKGHIGEKARSLVKKWKRLIPLTTSTNHQTGSDGQSNSNPDLNSSSVGTPHHYKPSHLPNSSILLPVTEEEDDFSRALQSTPTAMVTHRQNKETRHCKSERNSQHHGGERSRHKKERTEKRDVLNRTDHSLSSSIAQDQLSATVNESWRGVSPVHHSLHESQPVSSSEETSTSQSSIQRKRKGTFFMCVCMCV